MNHQTDLTLPWQEFKVWSWLSYFQGGTHIGKSMVVEPSEATSICIEVFHKTVSWGCTPQFIFIVCCYFWSFKLFPGRFWWRILAELENVRTQTFVRGKMSSKFHWGNSSKSEIIFNLNSFSAWNHVFLPHFYPQIRILIHIPQYSPQNESKLPHKFAIATYVRDFWTKPSSIL